MPGWVLLLSPDSLGAPELEQEIRLAGFSPRRAPDVARAQVLLGKGGPPAALVVDLAAMDGGLDAISSICGAFSRQTIVALTTQAEGALAESAERAGALVLCRAEARGALSTLLAQAVSPGG